LLREAPRRRDGDWGAGDEAGRPPPVVRLVMSSMPSRPKPHGLETDGPETKAAPAAI